MHDCTVGTSEMQFGGQESPWIHHLNVSRMHTNSTIRGGFAGLVGLLRPSTLHVSHTLGEPLGPFWHDFDCVNEALE